MVDGSSNLSNFQLPQIYQDVIGLSKSKKVKFTKIQNTHFDVLRLTTLTLKSKLNVVFSPGLSFPSSSSIIIFSPISLSLRYYERNIVLKVLVKKLSTCVDENLRVDERWCKIRPANRLHEKELDFEYIRLLYTVLINDNFFNMSKHGESKTEHFF